MDFRWLESIFENYVKGLGAKQATICLTVETLSGA